LCYTDCVTPIQREFTGIPLLLNDRRPDERGRQGWAGAIVEPDLSAKAGKSAAE
jgi:hypothetical protein